MLRPLFISAIMALALGLGAAQPVIAAAVDKERSESYLREARDYLKKGEVNAAIIQLKNSLKNDPDNVASRILLGDLYIRTGKGPAAEKELQGALRRGAKDPQVSINLGRAYLLQGKHQDVLDEIKAEDGAGDKKVDLLLVRARAHLGLKAYDESARLFNEARALKPDDVRPLLGLAQGLVNQRKIKEAEVQVDTALGIDGKSAQALILKGELRRLDRDLPGAVAQFDKALSVQPDNVLARLGRAASLVDLNRDEQALGDIEVVFQRVPKHPMASYLSALILAKKKDYVGAQDALQEAARFLEDHLPSVFLNGAINYARGQLEQAVTHLSRYVAAVPNNERARKLLGAAYVRKREADKAIETLAPVIKANPDDAQVLTLLGSAHMQKGDFNIGTEYYEKASQAAPDVAAIRTQLALSHLARGEAKEAVGSLETAVDLDPEARQAGVLLSLVRLRQRDYDGAIDSSTKLKKAMPDNPLAFNLLGAAHLGKGDLEKARAEFEGALKIRSDFHPARMNLAQLDLREEKVAAAKANYNAIIEDNPKHVGAMIALSDIAGQENNTDEQVSWLLKAGDANPKAIAPRLRLISHYSRNRDFEKAKAVARELNQNLPNNPRVLETLGRVESAAGDHIDAVATFQRLIELSRQAPRAYGLLAGAQIAAKDPDAARLTLERAIRADDAYVPAWIALIRLEMSEKQPAEALRLAEALRGKQPDKAVGDMLVGDIKAAQKDFAAALPAYEAALKKESTGLLAVRRYRAQTQLGKTDEALRDLAAFLEEKDDRAARHVLVSGYLSAQRHDEAIRESEKLLESDGNNPIVLNNLAWLYSQKGDKRARDYAEKALERAPKSPAIMDTLGWILVQQGETKRGLGLLRQAAELAPKMADIRYHLAAAMHKDGQAAAARKELERLLADEKPFSEKESAQKLLDQIRKGG